MAEKAPNQVQEIGKRRAVANPVIPSTLPLSAISHLKPDGYDGTLNADPMFGNIDQLRQMAMQQGKIS